MKIKDAIMLIMDRKGVSKASLARMRKITPQAVNSSLMKQKSMSVDTAIEFVSALDYKMVLVPGGKRLPDGCVEVTIGDDRDPARQMEAVSL